MSLTILKTKNTQKNVSSVADNYGVATYAIFLFLLTVWWSQVWGDASACPYTHMEDMLEGKSLKNSIKNIPH